MKVPIAGLLFFVLFVGFSANGQTTIWKEFSSTEGGFRVFLPGTPADLTVTGPAANGDRQFEYELKTHYVLFKMGFSKVPISPRADDALVMKSFWNKYIANMEKNEGIKVVSQHDFQVEGAFGREVVIDHGETILINRYIARDYYFYNLITVTYKENHRHPTVIQTQRKYLDSFDFAKSNPSPKP